MAMIESTQVNPEAGDQYLLLADISGYTGFLNAVVFTRPAPRSSNAGMTRVFSIARQNS